MTSDSLRRRLRRLGVRQGFEGGAQRKRRRGDAARPIDSLVAGQEVVTDLGPYFVAESDYPLDHRHGTRALADFLRCEPHVVAHVGRDEALAQRDLTGLAFFDIETTGLAGGAGTLAFVIGVGLVEDNRFLVRQYFLRDPAEEPAMLSGLADLLQGRSGLITFNGRTFDVPIVETRLALARRAFALRALPNLDLLPPARRLWRGRFEDCSLGTLEGRVLGRQRTEADVPGWLIPQLYVDYLRTGDAREMERVLYHNAEDILSMVTLAAHILEAFGNPLAEERSAVDYLRLAAWHDDLGQEAAAEAAYRAAAGRALPPDQRLVLYNRYAAFLKRAERRAEAAPLWQAWADLAPDDPAPCIELAKHYEWQTGEIGQAQAWASRALVCLTHWPRGWQRDEAWQAVQHRLKRLKRKRG